MSALWNKATQTVRGSMLLCILAGAVFSLPYFFEILFPLTYLSLVFFFLLLQTETLRTRFFRACFCFLIGFLVPLYSWFSALYPLSAFGISRPAALGIVLLGCLVAPAIQACGQGAILCLMRFLPKQPFLHAVGCGAVWVLSEKLHTIGELALPWGTVALSQTGFLPLARTVSLFGGSWIAFLAVSLCAWSADMLAKKRYRRLLPSTAILAGVCLLGILLPYSPLFPQPTGETIPAAAIQGNISTDEKWEGETLNKAFSVYTDLTKEAAQAGAQLILLPESAVPVYFTADGTLCKTFSSIAKTYDCTVVMGILREDDAGEHNSLVAFLPDGSYRGFYDKQHPVPFGEFVPLRALFSGWFPDLNQTQTMVSDDTPTMLSVGKWNAGCLLCFDSVFDAPQTAGEDNDFLLIATNDAWFGSSSGIYQHLRFAKLRAMESGKTLLRAGNTGISAWIDATGHVCAQTNALEQAVLYGEIEVRSGVTLYGRIGDRMWLLSLLLLLGMFGTEIFRRKKRS